MARQKNPRGARSEYLLSQSVLFLVFLSRAYDHSQPSHPQIEKKCDLVARMFITKT